MIAEGALHGGGPLGQPDGEEAERQGGDVGEHVARVRQERQRAGPEAAQHLGDQVEAHQRERHREPAAVVGAASGMLVVGV